MTHLRSTLAFLALAATPFLAPDLGAAVGDTHRPSRLPWSDVVQVASFDPALGKLSAVRLSIDTFVRMDLRAENLSDRPQLVSAHALANVSVDLPNGVSVVDMSFDGEELWTLAPFDGTADFGGASGETSGSSARRHVEVLIDDPAHVLYFVGLPEVGGTVELPVSAFGSTAILAGRQVLEHQSIDAGVRVRVQYLLDAND